MKKKYMKKKYMKKFKKGDKIYCIEGNDIRPIHPKIITHKIYTFIEYFSTSSNLIKIEECDEIVNLNRFISLKEARKLKIQKINEEI